VTGPTVDANFAAGFSTSWALSLMLSKKKKLFFSLSPVINPALGVVESSFHFYLKG
jgi:hypothetical protein